MKDEIKEILDQLEIVARKHTIEVCEDGSKIETMSASVVDELRLNNYSSKLLLDYITNLQHENDNLIKYNKICKKYLHNHERDYVDELGNICCKPSEYFNIAWAQDILDGDIESFEDLLQGSYKDE
jgi:hypothetical protein